MLPHIIGRSARGKASKVLYEAAERVIQERRQNEDPEKVPIMIGECKHTADFSL